MRSQTISRLRKNHADRNLPKEWQGVWSTEGKKCLTSDLGSNDFFVRISDRTQEMLEGECEVKVITSSTEGEKASEIQFLCAGEGYAWISIEQWKYEIIDVAKFLITANPNEKLVNLWRRCD
jgi:hypothetical protein